MKLVRLTNMDISVYFIRDIRLDFLYELSLGDNDIAERLEVLCPGLGSSARRWDIRDKGL